MLPAAEGGRGEGLIAVFALACLQETEEVSSSKKQDSILRPSLQYASKSSSFTSIKSCAHKNFTIHHSPPHAPPERSSYTLRSAFSLSSCSFTPSSSSMLFEYRWEKCVRIVYRAPTAFATARASSIVQCFFASACSCRSGVKVHSFSRTSTFYASGLPYNATIPAGKNWLAFSAGRPSPVNRKRREGVRTSTAQASSMWSI